ncbi:MAG TPA: hypothetical protein VGK99_16565 [Acidobacteriota bacterium]
MRRVFCLIFMTALLGILHSPATVAQRHPQTAAGQNDKVPPPQGSQQPATQPAPFTLPPPGEMQPVTTISFGGAEFIKAFNASADRVRLVLVFSPT